MGPITFKQPHVLICWAVFMLFSMEVHSRHVCSSFSTCCPAFTIFCTLMLFMVVLIGSRQHISMFFSVILLVFFLRWGLLCSAWWPRVQYTDYPGLKPSEISIPLTLECWIAGMHRYVSCYCVFYMHFCNVSLSRIYQCIIFDHPLLNIYICSSLISIFLISQQMHFLQVVGYLYVYPDILFCSHWS